MIEELYKLLTTFSDESRNAVLSRVDELNFNKNAGVVPWTRHSSISLLAGTSCLMQFRIESSFNFL
jgi:hypothetical protein